MQKILVVASMKPPRIISTFNRVLCNEITRDWCLVAPLSVALPTPTFRSMHFSRVTSTVTTDEIKKGFFVKTLSKLGLPDSAKYKRLMTGYLLYEDIAANVNYTNFFKDFKLPDTFYSWFVIMELHVWMLMTRYMAEGKPGHEIRNNIVEAMWSDVNERKSMLKKANAAALRTQIKELSLQFNAAIISYDEGIMSDDKVLAGALWRRFFQCEGNNPQHVATLVEYVRKQMNRLDRMPSEELMLRNSMQWTDYENP